VTQSLSVAEGPVPDPGRERRLGIGFVTAADPAEGQVLLLDLGQPPGAVLGRYRLRLDRLRQYVLQVLPEAAGGRVELTAEGVEAPPLAVRIADLTPCDVGTDFGLLFGHPAGAGLGEAERARVAITVGPAVAAPAPRPHPPIAIGHARQLFLDDLVVDALDGVRREQGTPLKPTANPVLRREYPWEAARCELYGSALWDPDGCSTRLVTETHGL